MDERPLPRAKPLSPDAAAESGIRGKAKTEQPRLGPYVILRKLGAGGMGQVYLARDPSLNREVAIKTLPPGAAGDQTLVARFLREARSAAQLHHSNAAAVYKIGTQGKLIYIAMEYVDGPSLDKLIAQKGPMAWREATQVVREAALGLAAAHEQGLIHRDIKPSNLMRTKAGVTKIVDFGLARAMAGTTQLTLDNKSLGTPAYMSPEQWNGKEADARSDLYSLVCTYYCLLTGEAPYEEATPAALGHLHCSVPLPDAREIVPELPEAVCRILSRGAQKDPAQRYQTAAELIAALDELLATSPEQMALADILGGESRPRSAVDRSARDETVAEQSSITPRAPAGHGARAFISPLPLGEGQGVRAWLVQLWQRCQSALPPRFRTRGWLVAAGAAAGIILMAAILLRIVTNNGTVTIEISDPKAQVEVRVDGDAIDIKGLGQPLRLHAGEHEVVVTGEKIDVAKKTFPVLRGENTVMHLDLQATLPPLAVAPFDAKKAKEHQEAWAKYLGVPVEITNSIGMKLVLIPPGEFLMGSPKELIEEELKRADNDQYGQWYNECLPGEGPQHRVRITMPFYLGTYLVTQEEYKRVMGTNPSMFSATGQNKDQVADQDTKRFPVENVSWTEAAEFCRKLSQTPEEKKAGRSYRLPSEAEWEYACRAGNAGRYGFSLGGKAVPKEHDENALSDYGWFNGNSAAMPHAVGLKRPSAWGLYDMHGDVWQWCQDWFDNDYYSDSPTDDPPGPSSGSNWPRRARRGGSWYYPARICRSANRLWCQTAGFHYFDLGFRVSLVLPDKPAEQVAVLVEPIVPVKPVPLDLKPDAKAWDLKPGSPLNPASLVLKPAAIKGLRSWTLETPDHRGGRGWPATGQLSPDDQRYATGGHDGVIRLLDSTTGKLRMALVNPELDIAALAWSPDNAYIAVGSTKGVVRIWNVAKGALVIGPAPSSNNQISSLAWSPDGTLLAVAHSGESAVMLWDVRETRQRAVLQEPADVNRSVNFLVWSADGKQLMATTDLAVRIWNVAGARLVQTLDPQTPQDQIGRLAAAWSPDGRRIATWCDYEKVKFFDSTYKLIVSGRTTNAYYWTPASMAWSPDGRHLAGGWLSGCDVLNADNGLVEFGIDGLAWVDASTGLSWSKDGARLFCTQGCSGTVTAVDAHSGKHLWQIAGRLPYDGHDTDICISPDGRQYATTVFRDRLYTWDAVQGAPAHDFGPSTLGQVAWSNDGRLAVAEGAWWGCKGDPGGRIWDPGEPSQSYLYRDGGFRCAAWSPDGKTLARGGTDVLVSTTSSDDPRPVFHAEAKAEVAKLVWGADNSTLAAGLDNNKVVILETPSGKVLRTLERTGLDGGIHFLAALPDGRLVAASGNGAVSVWNSKWEPVGELSRLRKTVHRGSDILREEINVNDGTLPAGGTTIAFATPDGIVLWDVDKQAVQGKIGTGPIWSVAWSLPLHRLIAAQANRLAIYDVPSGELLATQVIWPGPGKHLFLSPEGHVRVSPAMSEDVVYVALTDDGRQITLRQPEFAAAYGWKNDPEKIRLSSAAAAADKPRGGKAEKPR